MELRVIREPTVDQSTHGSLYIDRHWHAWTLEDRIREVPGEPVESWKIPRQTAIPAGRYSVILSRSNRFQRVLPEILGVPGFTGIRIHAGNTVADTEGCLLVGTGRTLVNVSGSRVALERLMGVLMDVGSKSPIWITLENP
jgi:hypothetical protein